MNAITGEVVGVATAQGLHFGDVLQYGRTVGGSVLRKMTFHERGRMLKALAMFLNERKAAYYELSYATGATKIDSWIDVDGGIGGHAADEGFVRAEAAGGAALGSLAPGWKMRRSLSSLF
jgi:oxepin-CoA hydrolase/3-oxo-5,6-dehydrosuberyl-CoA semialdehyde dehydrogenase